MDLGATRLHETAARVLAKVDGLLGATAPREVREARPDAHGAIDRSRWLRERIVSLEGEVWGSSYDNAYDEFELVNEALVNTLKAPALLKWARPPGTVAPARQMLVKLASDVQGPLEEGRGCCAGRPSSSPTTRATTRRRCARSQARRSPPARR